jgi:hypothetical protein
MVGSSGGNDGEKRVRAARAQAISMRHLWNGNDFRISGVSI